MSAENLARWLRNPQAVKPGNLMPNLNLSDQDIAALVAYLESLK
jgi:cytochrome c oxidase subunit 2